MDTHRPRPTFAVKQFNAGLGRAGRVRARDRGREAYPVACASSTSFSRGYRRIQKSTSRLRASSMSTSTAIGGMLPTSRRCCTTSSGARPQRGTGRRVDRVDHLTQGAIFGHLNVGHLISDARVAVEFLAYRSELADQANTTARSCARRKRRTRSISPPHQTRASRPSYRCGKPTAGCSTGTRRSVTRRPPAHTTGAFGLHPVFLVRLAVDRDVVRTVLLDKKPRRVPSWRSARPWTMRWRGQSGRRKGSVALFDRRPCRGGRLGTVLVRWPV